MAFDLTKPRFVRPGDGLHPPPLPKEEPKIAVDSNVLSLGTWAKMQNSPIVEKITWSLHEKGNILTRIPHRTKKSLKVNGVRWEGNLPDVNYRSLNEAPTVSTGSPTGFQEQAYIVRDHIDTDILMLEDENNITDPRGTRVEAYLRNWTYKANNYFINNTTAVDAKAPLGLRWRLDNTADSGVASEMKINAGAATVTITMTQAQANAFLEYVDTLLSYLQAEDGNGVLLLMNDKMKRRFATAIRIAGEGAGFASTKDNYDRMVETYRNAQILDLGRTSASASATGTVIASTENADGTDGASTHTSIYGVKVGEGDFYGWHFAPMRVIRRTNTDDVIIDRTTLQYVHGLMMENTRSIGRIYGLNLG